MTNQEAFEEAKKRWPWMDKESFSPRIEFGQGRHLQYSPNYQIQVEIPVYFVGAEAHDGCGNILFYPAGQGESWEEAFANADKKDLSNEWPFRLLEKK